MLHVYLALSNKINNTSIPYEERLALSEQSYR